MRPSSDGFQGFPPETAEYLARLSVHNNREWFEAHRVDYERLWLAPALAFAAAAGARIREIRPGVTVDPRVNGNVFRINRDVRFQRNKAPYKDHLDLWFGEGEKKTAASSFFFRLTAAEVIAGAGSHSLAGPSLARFRRAVANDESGGQLVCIMDDLRRAAMDLARPELQRTPPGFAALDPRRDDLIRHKALWVTAARPVGAWVQGPGVLDWAADAWARQTPLHLWLLEHTGPDARSHSTSE